MKIHPIFNIRLLSPYQENDIHGPNLMTPSPKVIDGNEEYEIAGIAVHQVRDGHMEYYTMWKNQPHDKNKWLTESDLAPHTLEILNDYRKMNHIAPFNCKWTFKSGCIKA